MAAVYCALVHHPVRDRAGQDVTTSVTNLDVHDIARSARTYGLKGYFIVHPVSAQRPIVERIVEHWCAGPGRERIPERTKAIELVRVASSISEVVDEISRREGEVPRLWATSAREPEGLATLRFPVAREELDQARPCLLLFGSGHGLATRVLEGADAVLEPIDGVNGYNHLSVRAAAAIVFDRLFGGAV